jgi:hypothetical protein
MVDRNDFTDDLDEDQDEQEEGGRIAEPATKPPAPPDTITVEIGPGERLNLAVKMVHLMDEQKLEKKEAAKHAKKVKELQEEIDGLALAIRTGTKEMPNGEQQSLLDQPVGQEAAAATFGDLAKQAEAAAAAAEAPAEWKPEHHPDTCPAKKGPLHGCACGWNKAHGGPVAEEEFEASAEELEKQGGRKRAGKKVA